MQPMIVEQVMEILLETGLDPCSLKLEITESVMMEGRDYTMRVLERLSEAGIELSLDDFGTGYSSLSYIHRFPVSTLKIDQSFIKRIGGDQNGEIVRAVVTLARNLGMEVVAEGIETELQLDQLRALNCEQGQGFYFSIPVDVESATALIEKDERGEVLRILEQDIGYRSVRDDRGAGRDARVSVKEDWSDQKYSSFVIGCSHALRAGFCTQ